MHFLYKNWAKPCLALALISFGCIFGFKKELSPSLFWIWLQLPIYFIHEFEEHVWPGKFKEFVNRDVFHSKKQNIPLNDAGVFWINISLVWALFPLTAILAQTLSPKIGAFLPIVALFNATTHIVGGIVKKKYNPGLAASVTLNYPLGIYALFVLSNQNNLSWETGIICFALSLLVHLGIVAFVLRRWIVRDC